MDSWRCVHIDKALSKGPNDLTFVIPYQDDTLSEPLSNWLQHDDQKIALRIASASCTVHKDSRAQQAPSRIEVRIGVWSGAPLSPAKVLYKALDYCLNQFLHLVRQWTLVSLPTTSAATAAADQKQGDVVTSAIQSSAATFLGARAPCFRIVKSPSTECKESLVSLLDQELTFRLRDVPQPYSNSLRRALITDVPTVAISRVVMLENTSNYHDTALAQHLTMLPITISDYKALTHLKFAPECTCQLKMEDTGLDTSKSLDLNKMTLEQFESKLDATKRNICYKCSMVWEFDMTHDRVKDAAMQYRPLLMTTDNFQRICPLLKLQDRPDQPDSSKDDVKAVASTDVPGERVRLQHLAEGIHMPARSMFFGKLNYGQRVHMLVVATKLTAAADKGARWQASGPVGFRPVPEIILDKQAIQKEWTADQRRQIVESCPKRVFAIRGSKEGARRPAFSSMSLFADESKSEMNAWSDGVLDIENAGLDCSRCGACTSLTHAWKTPSAIVIRNARRDEHEFVVRPRNNMRAHDIVMSALNALAGKCFDVMVDMRENIMSLQLVSFVGAEAKSSQL